MPKSPKEQLGDIPDLTEPEVVVEQTNPEPEPETEERPDWLLPKFESPEAQAQAYAEAEKRMHESNKERNALEERLTALEAQLQQYSEYDQYDPSQLFNQEEYLAQMYEQDPAAATREIIRQELQNLQQQASTVQQQRAPLLEAQQRTNYEIMGDLVSQRMASKYPDWNEHYEKVQEILTEDAKYLPVEQFQDMAQFQQLTEKAYKLAKYDDLTAREQAMQAAGMDQAEIDRQMKLGAQTMSGRSARPAEPTPQEQLNAELLAAHQQNQRYSSWANQTLGS